MLAVPLPSTLEVCMTIRRTLALTLLSAATLPSVALAQSGPAAFDGVWSGWLTTQEHTAWTVEDYSCFVGCPKVSYEHLTTLLDNPANDQRPLNELVGETRTFITEYLRQRSTPAGLAMMEGNSEANDTNLACHPYDYVRSATNPLPFEIIRNGDTLTINYEEWNRTRTVYLDGRAFPAPLAATSLGYSIGHYEGDTLVIETRGLVASTYAPITINAAGGHSEQLSGVERYTVTPGETPILALELTLTDPGTLREPYVYYKRWIATPDIELLTDSCADKPGVF
jgi:hypothetical protein